LVVYNLHRARQHAKEAGLIVVEGFFDAMRVWQAGFPNVVALMGSSLSEEQEGLLVDAVGPHGKIALMFDEDEAGWHGRDGIWKDEELKPGALPRLASKVYVNVIRLGDQGRQPDGLSKEELKRAILGI
jgi:DNA primase